MASVRWIAVISGLIDEWSIKLKWWRHFFWNEVHFWFIIFLRDLHNNDLLPILLMYIHWSYTRYFVPCENWEWSNCVHFIKALSTTGKDIFKCNITMNLAHLLYICIDLFIAYIFLNCYSNTTIRRRVKEYLGELSYMMNVTSALSDQKWHLPIIHYYVIFTRFHFALSRELFYSI